MRALRFLCFFLLISCAAKAQFRDTLRACVKRGASFAFDLDGRNSFISDRKAPIWGIKIGAKFGGKFTVGGGWNMQRPHLTKNYYFGTGFGPDHHIDTVTAQLNYNYMSYFVRFVYYRDARWECSVTPAHVGFGTSSYSYTYLGEKKVVDRKFTVSYEMGLSVSYKVVRWVSVGADLGLRLMVRPNKAIPENFNSPYYSFYVSIDWIEIYKTAFPNTKLAKRL